MEYTGFLCENFLQCIPMMRGSRSANLGSVLQSLDRIHLGLNLVLSLCSITESNQRSLSTHSRSLSRITLSKGIRLAENLQKSQNTSYSKHVPKAAHIYSQTVSGFRQWVHKLSVSRARRNHMGHNGVRVYKDSHARYWSYCGTPKSNVT